VSLAVQNEGDVCVCNKNTQSFEDGSRNKLYLHEVGLKRMWSSPTRRLVTTGLDYNKKLSSCSACWKDEEANVVSSRQQFNQRLENLEPSKDQPSILILKPTNICNLGCRTCQPATSTGLYQDFYKLETAVNNYVGSFKDYTKQFESIRDGLGKNNLDTWDTFEEWLPGLTFLDIYGGEPMLAPAMWERMIKSANDNKVSNTAIQFHTNGTIWNQEYIDILPKFKSVHIGISIDSNNPAQLAYIRHGVNVDVLQENIKKYIELTKQYNNITAYICCTVSSYNVWDLNTIVSELRKHNLPVGINVVHAPEKYDIRHLPQEVKQKIISRLTDPSLQKIIKLLNHTIPGCDVEWPKFCKEVDMLDNIRDQKFSDVFPDYYTALKPYIV
jgi:MoaA/NifB/PqqE/SkfB family radical SAM enzyme